MPEKDINFIPEEAREVVSDAEKRILRNVGMEFSDLRKYGKILDLGAAGANLERAAVALGYDNIISLEKIESRSQASISKSIKPKNLVMASARLMPFSDDTFDLVIIHGVPQFTRHSNQLLANIKEAQRVLKKGCEIRNYPAFFDTFYRKNFTAKMESYYNLFEAAHKHKKKLSAEIIALKKEEQQQIKKRALDDTLNFLADHGVSAHVEFDANSPKNNPYLVIKK